jgi:uncharacterized damage-inducible protein DinB
MLAMIQDLVRHKWHANATLLGAIMHNEQAAQDEELRTLFHHILIANRYWLFLILQQEFVREEEGHIPDTFDPLIARYQETESLEMEWLSQFNESGMESAVQTPFLSGQNFSVAQAMMQVSMHSLGHRAQCASRLRSLGGIPPATDFILWLKERPAPDWPSRKVGLDF